MRPTTEAEAVRMGGFEYRLGDLVHGYFDLINASHFFCTHWPFSIGCAYAQRRRRSTDYSVIRELVHGGEVPPSDALIVHVRTGDVLDWPLYREKYRCHTACRWIRPQEAYAHVCIPRAVTSVHIVSNPTYRTVGQRSHSYLNALRKIFEQHGYPVQLRTNASADDDLRYISNARYIVPAMGRFGHVAQLMARAATIVNLTCDKKPSITEPL